MEMRIDLQTLVLLIVAVMNAVTMYYTRRTEKNTNSMKDALVLSTAKISHAEGKEEGRAIGEQKAADLIVSESKSKSPQAVEVVNEDPVPVTVKKV